VCLVSVSKNVTCGYGHYHKKCHLSTWSLTKNATFVPVTVTKNVTCVPGHYLQKCHLCVWSLTKNATFVPVTVTKNVTYVAGHHLKKISPVYLVTVTISNQLHRS
jgi:hypothetical protein